MVGAGACAFYLHLHRWAGSVEISDLPDAPMPETGRRILVLSPHCDDETLGAGAMIADARHAGIPVTVAFLTNGDGFRVAASRELEKVSITPADFVKFAEVRQKESLAALKELGVDQKDVQFFGYPDQGLKPMWEWNWSPKTPYRSRFTDRTYCPYTRAYNPHSLYCGQDLMTDLMRLMATVRPTDIYVTHPSDDHPDHYIAAAYAEAALRECQETVEERAWSRRARIHFYIVHRGDWPIPQGLYADRPLLPPPGLARLDTHWLVYQATADSVKAKRRALEQYVSQTSIEGRFLHSFIRRNELFGDITDGDIASVPAPETTTLPAAYAASPDKALASVEDPVGDDVIRYATPGADLTGLNAYVLPGRQAIRIQISTHGPVSRRVRYSVLLRAMRDARRDPSDEIAHRTGVTGFVTMKLTPTVTDIKTGSKTLDVTVPLSELGLYDANGCVWVSAETRFSSRLPVVDRIGYRPFIFKGAPIPMPAAAATPSTIAAVHPTRSQS